MRTLRNTAVSLVPELGEIHADGSLGELLRSGILGNTIREKIQKPCSPRCRKAQI
ncbi:MAG TPA: hypothetical protein VHT24_10600 [Pseudacidobacterium sp.]|jgi:hypothetical protein|nr:hypothetical protein [Pseudacidobacterium sp.]